MAQEFVDLHCHSTASDGTLPPREVVRLAHDSGLVGLAITDHDTIGGVADARDEAQKLGLIFIPGIEISCSYPPPGTMHILGYGVDPNRTVLQSLTRHLIEARDNRNPKIIARLNELGVAITMEEVEREAGGQVVGRPHIAAILQRKGYVSSIKQAFDKYLGQGAARLLRQGAPRPQERPRIDSPVGRLTGVGAPDSVAHEQRRRAGTRRQGSRRPGPRGNRNDSQRSRCLAG